MINEAHMAELKDFAEALHLAGMAMKMAAMLIPPSMSHEEKQKVFAPLYESGKIWETVEQAATNAITVVEAKEANPDGPPASEDSDGPSDAEVARVLKSLESL